MCMQTQLFDGMLPASDDEVYIAALANLASGLRTATPANIKTAIKLLHGIGNKTEPATGRCCMPSCSEAEVA